MKKEKKKITAMKILVSVFVVGVVTHSLHNMQKMQNAPYSKKSTSKKKKSPSQAEPKRTTYKKTYTMSFQSVSPELKKSVSQQDTFTKSVIQ